MNRDPIRYGFRVGATCYPVYSEQSVIAHKLKTDPFMPPTTQSQNRPSKFKLALEEPKSLKQTRGT